MRTLLGNICNTLRYAGTSTHGFLLSRSILSRQPVSPRSMSMSSIFPFKRGSPIRHMIEEAAHSSSHFSRFYRRYRRTPTQSQWTRVRNFVHKIERMIERGRQRGAFKTFKNQINLVAPLTQRLRPYRFNAFERTVDNFLQRNHFAEASRLSDMMLFEGFYPSSGLRARLLVHRHFREPVALPGEILPALQDLVAQPSFTEWDLAELLDSLKIPAHLDVELVKGVVDHFITARGDQYELSPQSYAKLIRIYVSAGHRQAAVDLFSVPHRTVPLPRPSRRKSASNSQYAPQPQSPRIRPLTTLISELAAFNSVPARVDEIIARMSEEGVVPDVPLFNSLIAGAVRQHDYYKAFALYKALLSHGDIRLVPDAFTFASLFKALEGMSKSRRAALRRAKVPSNVRGGRDLFRDMIECHTLRTYGVPERASAVLKPFSLHMALRMFLHSNDYHAACVVLRAFGRYHVRVDGRTYRSVLAKLVATVHAGVRERRKPGELRWADRFLYADVFAEGEQPLLPRDLVNEMRAVPLLREERMFQALIHLFEYAARPLTPPLTPDSAPAPTPAPTPSTSVPKRTRGRQFRVPRRARVLGLQVDPREAHYDAAPLEHILYRTLWASLDGNARAAEEPRKAIVRALEPVEDEMAPSLTEEQMKGLEEMRIARWGK